MLTSLSVKNFAIIDNIQIDFKPQMTVLTGETGAGKSLIIDAIGLLFGDRASTDLVRYDEQKAIIEGIFDSENNDVLQLLQENDIDVDDFLIIRREIFNTGKSICKVNGTTVSLALIQELSTYLGNIHTQFDAQKLINPKNYLSLIDDEEVKSLLPLYHKALHEYQSAESKMNELEKKNLQSNEKLDFYNFQLDELKKANLNISEEEDLKNQFNILSNYEKIFENINAFKKTYDEENVLDKIYLSIANLTKIASFDSEIVPLQEQLEEHFYALQDLVLEISTKYSENDFSLNDLENVNSRLATYSQLHRKYRMNTKELLEYQEKIATYLADIENYDFLIEEMRKNVKNCYDKAFALAQNISDIRKNIAKKITEKTTLTLVDLQLKDTVFSIQFKDNDQNLLKDGIDEIDFLVTFNKGEPLKPLSKIASGGELSRFMLALKVNVADKFTSQTLIFDEIDNGVSGLVAYSIANKIKSLALKSQILCVTHLPQVAAIADHQVNIRKKTLDNERTATDLKELTKEERIIEIAKMIANGVPTDASINLAKELLNK